jgi:peptide/nickel transport system substrate-binding protein
MKKKVLAVVLVAVMAVTLAACGNGGGSASSGSSDASGSPSADTGGSAATGEPQYGGVVKFIAGDTNEPFGLPWRLVAGNNTLTLPYGETLVLERSNGDIEPWLAESWEIDEEAQEIRFYLKEGVTFSDGSAFNAEVVVWNLEKSREANALNPAITGMEARGDYEVAVFFDNYLNSILGIFASHTFFYVSKENFEKNGEEFALENPVGTGPFVLKSWVPGGTVEFVKNEEYWQEGKPYLDGIVYENITETVTQNVAVQSTGADGIDALNTFNAEQMATLLDTAPVTVEKNASGPISLYPSSMDESSPLSKLEVRQAISYAINREAIVAARGFDILKPAYQFIPEGYKGHLPESDNLPGYDPEKAKELLAAAGYPDGFKTKLIGAFTFADQDAVVAIADQLGEVGIECELEFPDAGGSLAYQQQGWDGLFVMTARALASITSTFRLIMDPDYQFYPSMWRPADEMLPGYTKIRSAVNLDEKDVQDLHKMVLDNMVLIPVYDTYDAYVVKDNVHGAEFAQWGAGTQWLAWDMWKEQ